MEDKTVELQFITHFTDTYSYYDSARMALEGGCRWIQLRMKDASEAEITREALRILPLCREHGATFIIDDHVEIVRKTGADGVHLGAYPFSKILDVDHASDIEKAEAFLNGKDN